MMESSTLSMTPPRTIWYMGAKARVLTGFLDEILEQSLEPGQSVFDLFSGTATVAFHCARSFQVIANDVQRYAHIIAKSLIERPPGGGVKFSNTLDFDGDLSRAFEKNRSKLQRLYAAPLAVEDLLLEEYGQLNGGRPAPGLAAQYREFLETPGGLYGGGGIGPAGAGRSSRARSVDPLYRRAATLLGESSIGRYRKNPRLRPACLITSYYANVYYGIRQAIDLDSLRAAIDDLGDPGPLPERKRIHYLSALIHAASVTTSGTSHFAQPRQLRKDSELLAMARRRRLDVLKTFREFSEEIAQAVASTELHRKNRCLCADYRRLLEDASKGPLWIPEVRADLIYMDPPYTADNYSRFYHVLEALACYDYPPLQRNAQGRVTAGRYPEIANRFQSAFCRPRTVEGEFERIITASANSGSKLVISYGSPNGLLLKVYRKKHGGKDPVGLLAGLCRARFKSVEVLRRRLLHSGQGDSNIDTDELLLVCERPR